jgi:hypothetical protein
MTKGKATATPRELAPGESHTFVLEHDRSLLFKGHHLVNLGDAEDLHITAVLVGETLQLAPDVILPLRTMEIWIDACPPAIYLSVKILNTSRSHSRRVAFEILGRELR